MCRRQGFPESTNHTCPKIRQYDVYICEKLKKKQENKQKNTHTGPYCYCFVGLLCGITWSPVELRVNRTFVEWDMFKRGNNLFSYYSKNRELYICICKRSLRTLSFLNRKYFTKAPQGNGRYLFFFIWFYFIYSICNYVMYRWGIEIK